MAEPQITGADRYQWMLCNPDTSRILFSQLAQGTISGVALAVFIDRIISIEAELEAMTKGAKATAAREPDHG